MRQKKERGLQLSSSPEPAAAAGWLPCILTPGAVYALLELTGVEAAWLPALAGAAPCLAALLPGKRRWAYSGALALAVLMLLLLRTRLLDGFCQWYNGAGKILTAHSGRVLPPLEVSGDAGNLLLFSCWLSCLFGLCMVLLARLRPQAAPAAVLVLCAAASAALGRMPGPVVPVMAALMLSAGRGRRGNGLAVGILTAAVVLSLLPGLDRWAVSVSEAVRSQVHQHRYETRYTTLPEGRLEPLAPSDATALVVTMEKPEVLYLRGFTGAELREERWLPLDTQVLAENQELLYWLSSREFDPMAQLEAAASALETGSNSVTVQNVGACSAYRYVPFTLRADGGLVPENLTGTAPGTRYDSFTTVSGGAALVTELLTAPEAADSRYLRAETAYREFVREHYLDIPPEAAEKMQPYWDAAAGLDAQSAVRAVLENCYPDGARNDPYYATAAVLTLRRFGIPARYAEGYILPETTATTVELTGSHAACWAEVYQDGIGWMPMALTPGPDGEREQQEQLPPDTPAETLPPETEPSADPQPDGGYRVRVARLLLSGAVIAVGLLLLCAGALVLRRRHILKRRRAVYTQADIREAAAWCFADSIALLERLGIRRGNGSPEALTAPVRERFGDGAAMQLEAACRINALALFSGRPMTEEQRQAVLGFRSTVEELLLADANRLSKFRMKYILCLF